MYDVHRLIQLLSEGNTKKSHLGERLINTKHARRSRGVMMRKNELSFHKNWSHWSFPGTGGAKTGLAIPMQKQSENPLMKNILQQTRLNNLGTVEKLMAAGRTSKQLLLKFHNVQTERADPIDSA
jgi:hypothetical protein